MQSRAHWESNNETSDSRTQGPLITMEPTRPTERNKLPSGAQADASVGAAGAPRPRLRDDRAAWYRHLIAVDRSRVYHGRARNPPARARRIACVYRGSGGIGYIIYRKSRAVSTDTATEHRRPSEDVGKQIEHGRIRHRSCDLRSNRPEEHHFRIVALEIDLSGQRSTDSFFDNIDRPVHFIVWI